MKSSLEILTEAKELLADPGAWTKGAYARDRFGELVGVFDDTAACFCVTGAMYKSTRADVVDLGDVPDSYYEALELMDDVLPDTACKSNYPSTELAVEDFNDSPDTTYEDVLAVLNKAIERAKES